MIIYTIKEQLSIVIFNFFIIIFLGVSKKGYVTINFKIKRIGLTL